MEKYEFQALSGEAVEEKTSLADRFGLWVPFHIFSQDQYLELVSQLVKKHSFEYQIRPVLDDELFDVAIRWSRNDFLEKIWEKSH